MSSDPQKTFEGLNQTGAHHANRGEQLPPPKPTDTAYERQVQEAAWRWTNEQNNKKP